MHNEIPQNTQEAVELGLYLAITADTDAPLREAWYEAFIAKSRGDFLI